MKSTVEVHQNSDSCTEQIDKGTLHSSYMKVLYHAGSFLVRAIGWNLKYLLNNS